MDFSLLVLISQCILVISCLSTVIPFCVKTAKGKIRGNRNQSRALSKENEIVVNNVPKSKEEPEKSNRSTKTVRGKEELRALDSLRVHRKPMPKRAEPTGGAENVTQESEDESEEIHIVMENVEKRPVKETSRLMLPDQYKKDVKRSKKSSEKESLVTFDTSKQPRRKKIIPGSGEKIESGDGVQPPRSSAE